MRSQGVALVALVAVALTGGCTPGEEDSRPEANPFSRTLRTPSPLPPIGAPIIAPTPPGGLGSVGNAYPLSGIEALNYVSNGYPVAAPLDGTGAEILIQKTAVTEYEEKPVPKETCGYEYDYSEGKEVYGCSPGTAYERTPVQKTKFMVSGPGLPTVSYDSVYAAFASVATTEWRRV